MSDQRKPDEADGASNPAFDTQPMPGEARIDPSKPDPMDPAFATQIAPPQLDLPEQETARDLPPEDSLNHLSKTIPADNDQIRRLSETIAATQKLPDPDLAAAPSPEDTIPAEGMALDRLAQTMTAVDLDERLESDTDIGMDPPAPTDSNLMQTMPSMESPQNSAAEATAADLSVDGSAPTRGDKTQQPDMTVPDVHRRTGVQHERDTASPSGRSTWNLRIKERGIEGYVSGIINEIPQDHSQSSGLQSALVSDASAAEYEIRGELGAGAMGIVYQATQTSLNRELAIKTLKPTSRNSDHDQAMFVSEAVVTANLVHPNIVPIHDLGRNDEGKLFYSMKQVTGTPWNKTIRDNSLEDNLDIFLKMCDAVAYAHSRGVINRDLKPENVLVGDFGEVIVLDWGLAITTDEFPKKNSVIVNFQGGSGTPVYMAPELANTDIRAIGKHSDIYLLGAILFEVLEGFPPHMLRDNWESSTPQEQLQSVIMAVLHNRIEPNVTNDGELMQIAMRAMQTDPADRWASVEQFQEAIREYRITGRAEELLKKVTQQETDSYEHYQGAVALYDEALRKWPDNQRAQDGDRRARLAYARLAHRKGDVDLGLQVLADTDDVEFQTVRAQLKRTHRSRRIVRTTWLMLFFAAIGLSGWLVSKNNELFYANQAVADKTAEVEEKSREVDNKTREAEKQTAIAQSAARKAAEDRKLATAARAEAEEQTRLATELKVSVDMARAELQTQTTLAMEATDKARVASQEAEKQTQAANQARLLAEKQTAAAEVARREAMQQEELAQVARKDAARQKKLADEQTQVAMQESLRAAEQTKLAAAAEQDKLLALKEAEKTRIEGRLEQVDAKMEIRKYDDVVRLVEDALQEFQSIADQPDLLELLEKKKQEALRLTGNTSAQLDDRTDRAASSTDGRTVAIASWKDGPQVTVYPVTAEHQINLSEGTVVVPDGRTVRDISVQGNLLSLIGRSSTSRNFYHQLWVRRADGWQSISRTETSTRRPPQCLLSPDGDRAYLVTSGRTGTVTVYDTTGQQAQTVAQQTLDETTGTFPAVLEAVLLPDESALILATKEGCVSVNIQWQDEHVQISHRKKGEAFANVFPTPRGLNRLGQGGDRERFAPRRLALSADGSTLALINGTRALILPRDQNADRTEFPFVSPDQLPGNGILDTDYGTRMTAAFSADGRRLVTAGRRYLQVWQQSEQGFVLAPLEGLYEGNALAGHSRSIEHVGFLGGTTEHLLSVSGDGVLRTWQTDSYGAYVKGMQSLADEFDRGAESALRRKDAAATNPRSPSAVEEVPAKTIQTSWQSRESRYLLTALPADTTRARRQRQGRRVFSAEFSQDDERVLIGANDLAAHTFEAATASRTASLSMQYPRDSFFAPQRNNFLEGHIPEIVSVRFLPPDGRLLLTLDYFGSISVWDAEDDANGIGHETSRPLPRQPVVSEDIDQPYEVEDPSCEITVSRDGQWIMAGGVRNDGQADIRASEDEYFVAVWKTEQVLQSATPRPWRVLTEQHEARITAAAFSPDGTRTVTGGRRGQLVVWDVQDNRVVATRAGAHHSDGISGLFFVSETEFISAGFDGQVIRWQLQDGQLTDITLKRGSDVKDPDFIIRLRPSADGRQFVTSDLTRQPGSNSYRLQLNQWSSSDGWQRTLSAEIQAPPEDPGRSYRHDVSWSQDGHELLFVQDETLMVFDTTSWKPVHGFRLPAGTRAVRGAFSPSAAPSRRIATFDGRFAHLWNVETGRHIVEFRSHGPFVRAGYSSDRRYLITGSDSIRVFDADETSPDHGRPLFRLSRNVTGRSVFAAARFSPVPDDYRFATVDRTGSMQLWDWTPGGAPPQKPTFVSGRPEDMVAEYTLPNTVCWSPTATHLAAVQLGQPALWRVTVNGLEQVQLQYPRGMAPVDLIMNDLDFSADGTYLTAGGSYEDESYALVWKIEDQQAIPVGSINAEEYHSSADDNADGLTGILSIAWDAGRREILTGGTDSRVLRWQVRKPDPGEVAEYRYIAAMLGTPADEFRTPHQAAVSDVDVAGNGSILTADEAGYFVIWPADR